MISDNITFKKESFKLIEGQSETLEVNNNGIFVGNSGLIWRSSNNNVAVVDHAGKVTAVGEGSSVITAKVRSTGKEISCNVDVIPSMVVSANGVDIPLIKVNGGTFSMGATPEQANAAADNEKPAHQVTLSDYYIGQTEVTQELWEAVMGSNPSKYKEPNHPISVSWDAIVNDFLPKLNLLTGKTFTLPTEAQWEFAARGGNKSKSYMYSGSNNIDDVAWYYYNSNGTNPVGQKLPNELIIYDMSGNVNEWCSDWYGAYSAEAQKDPTGPASGSYRVLRSGSYGSSAMYCRVSFRDCDLPDYSSNYHGFRLALSL